MKKLILISICLLFLGNGCTEKDRVACLYETTIDERPVEKLIGENLSNRDCILEEIRMTKNGIVAKCKYNERIVFVPTTTVSFLRENKKNIRCENIGTLENWNLLLEEPKVNQEWELE